jgi:hypothetical protein
LAGYSPGMHLTRIRPLFETPGPYLTVHAEVGRTSEAAAQQLDARWTTIRHALEKEGISSSLVQAVDQRLHENPHVHGEARLTLVGSGDEVLFADVVPGHVDWPETCEVAPLPDLAGWLHGEDGRLPFALVVLDREGADVDFWSAANRPAVQHEQVQGDTFYITKVAEGDWAQKQFQQTAENTWKHNAQEVADAVLAGIRRHRPRLVVLAGEEHMRSEVASALEGAPADVVQTTAGGRAAGASRDALWQAVEEALARYVADDEARLVDSLLEGTGRGEGVARGLEPVLEACAMGQAETLVLDLQTAREMTVRPTDHPGLPLPGTVGDDTLPADRVLVAAAAATDADLALLPVERTKGQGVSALLRWDDRS